MSLNNLFTDYPYTLERNKKQNFLTENLRELTVYHTEHCELYRKIVEALPKPKGNEMEMEDIPFLPVGLFKMHDFRSVPLEAVINILTSSGTTGQAVSRVSIDRETSFYQKKALVSILKSFVGKKRYPMIMVDTANIISRGASLSARGAGLMGLTFVGRDYFYLLDENMKIDWAGLEDFIDKHKDEKIIVFGFTFMVWQYLYKACLKEDRFFYLPESILIHSGGWKKLQEEAVDNQTFKQILGESFHIERIHNFYGMAEQVGSVFMECEKGHLHAADFSDVLIRDPMTLEVLPVNEVGLIQVMSILPRSYPGHSLLTEDLGKILGEDNCLCGRKGKYFEVRGRLPKAELRGCSDTHAYGERQIG